MASQGSLQARPMRSNWGLPDGQAPAHRRGSALHTGSLTSLHQRRGPQARSARSRRRALGGPQRVGTVHSEHTSALQPRPGAQPTPAVRTHQRPAAPPRRPAHTGGENTPAPCSPAQEPSPHRRVDFHQQLTFWSPFVGSSRSSRQSHTTRGRNNLLLLLMGKQTGIVCGHRAAAPAPSLPGPVPLQGQRGQSPACLVSPWG